MFEIEIQRCTRRCAVSERDLLPGERIFSALVPEGAEVVRKDFGAEGWNGPPEGAIGWWQSQIPSPESKKVHWAPNEVMLNLFLELENNPAEQDMRYVLGLLMVRRRIMRLDAIVKPDEKTDDPKEEPTGDEQEEQAEGDETLVLFCAKTDTEYRIPVVTPSETRIAEIQEKLGKLLFK